MRTYGSIALSPEGDLWIISDAEPHVSIRLKQVFPSIPKAKTPPYKIPRTPVTDVDLSWFFDRYPLAMSPEDKTALEGGRQQFLFRQAEMEAILLPDYAPSETVRLREGQTIRPYQWQAIEILRRRGRLLLADEVGLGKTYEAAGFLVAEPSALPSAVVCDAHTQRQWKEKIEAFTELRVHAIKKGSPYDLPKADVYIYRVSQTSGWADIFKTGFFKSAIYDEPQSLRTGTSTQKGMACNVLSKNTKWHLGLTATPVYNYGDEMWRVMQFIDDSVLGKWDDFSREWCVPIGNGHCRVKNPKALGSYLREQYAVLRRLKSDVGQQLPKVSKVIEYVDYDAKAVADVESLARQLAIKATTGTFVERGSAARDLDVMVRQATGLSKAKSVATFARMVVESGEPVVIWAWHRGVYDVLLEELKDLNPAMYTGSESISQKEEAKSKFVKGKTEILIMSLRSGAGVDGLQHRCCTGIFGELDWSPGIHDQCIGRLDREGQKNPVTAFYLVTDDGSDPPIMDVLGIKASEAHHIVDPNLGLSNEQADTGNLRKLVERYLGRKNAGAEQQSLPLQESA